MIALACIAGYFALGFPVFRVLFREFANNGSGTTGGDIAAGCYFGGLGWCAWPVLAPFMLLARAKLDWHKVGRKIGGESRADKASRIERERREDKARIRELERQLGIGRPYPGQTRYDLGDL